MTEIYKFPNDLSLQTMSDNFQNQENYCSLRNPVFLVFKRKFTTTYDINTTSFRRLQDFHQDIKTFDSLNLLEFNIKKFGSLICYYKISKTFFPCIGSIS